MFSTKLRNDILYALNVNIYVTAEEDLLEELGEEEEQPEGDGQQTEGDGVEPGETDVQPETGEDSTRQEPQGEVKPPTETTIETKV